ncbi:hypothetical protein CH63R_14543 [Colletotrichum higginsianum IMI 349063]|uniref:Uncharacterized protein n=1 Tax=Colletotrichum higginsianum (strain IMI 349063) TaxID=759273 RepID=A0A1B7XQE6_COLHI|nr:hypothetical protein CH63R_14543 [Colletotrichum higginsianum IMI 349063]OBR01971.1 hypothetical protein CH63R_14543 [Colletotrichum higginsianum IMI 349063]
MHDANQYCTVTKNDEGEVFKVEVEEGGCIRRDTIKKLKYVFSPPSDTTDSLDKNEGGLQRDSTVPKGRVSYSSSVVYYPDGSTSSTAVLTGCVLQYRGGLRERTRGNNGDPAKVNLSLKDALKSMESNTVNSKTARYLIKPKPLTIYIKDKTTVKGPQLALRRAKGVEKVETTEFFMAGGALAELAILRLSLERKHVSDSTAVLWSNESLAGAGGVYYSFSNYIKRFSVKFYS